MRNYQLALLCAVLATAVDAQRDGRRGRDTGSDLALENFTYETVEMKLATGDRSLQMGVYLPKGYAAEANAETVYPWVVWLHGRNENQHKFHRDGGAGVLDKLRGDDRIPALIFVALSLGRSPIYLDGSTAGDQEKWIVEGLPKFLAEKYRLADDRSKRAVMGVSMGGFGGLKIAMRHPQTFATVAVHSSALMPADPEDLPPQYQRFVRRMLQRGGLDEVFGDPIDKDRWANEMPLALARDMELETLKSLNIYFDAGSDDRYGFAPPNKQLHELLEERGVPHTFELVDGGGHSWGSGSLQKQLVKSLQFVAHSLAGTKRAATKDAEPEPAATIK